VAVELNYIRAVNEKIKVTINGGTDNIKDEEVCTKIGEFSTACADIITLNSSTKLIGADGKFNIGNFYKVTFEDILGMTGKDPLNKYIALRTIATSLANALKSAANDTSSLTKKNLNTDYLIKLLGDLKGIIDIIDEMETVSKGGDDELFGGNKKVAGIIKESTFYSFCRCLAALGAYTIDENDINAKAKPATIIQSTIKPTASSSPSSPAPISRSPSSGGSSSSAGSSSSGRGSSGGSGAGRGSSRSSRRAPARKRATARRRAPAKKRRATRKKRAARKKK
jgi:uncharacterized membrane protein YgcG